LFIPIIEPPAIKKVESKKFFAHPQLPHLLTYPPHFAMAKPISLLGLTFQENILIVIFIVKIFFSLVDIGNVAWGYRFKYCH
jgi:hypothetical protein